MDEYWRKKDLAVAGNCLGGPAVTPGGHGTKPKSFKPDCQNESGSPLIFTHTYPPFDPTVPPPPLPPLPTSTGALPSAPLPAASLPSNDLYKNPPPVIYYPTTEPRTITYATVNDMENTPEKTQTASNIR